jgi:predicted enzyme related to lactoylglutathione lyase
MQAAFLRLRRVFLFAIFLVGMTGCARNIVLPPITEAPTGLTAEGKFVWMDLITNDVATAGKFYGSLLGWQITGADAPDAPFASIRQNGRLIGSIVYYDGLDRSRPSARWLSYISVKDVAAMAARSRTLGGTVFMEPREFPDRGTIAVIVDPQGAVFGILRAKGGDPPEEKPGPMGWMWHELWTSSSDSAKTFYSSLLGYTQKAVTLPGISGEYQALEKEGTLRGGVGQLASKETSPLWLPYVNVDDPAAVAGKAQTLGGTVILPPDSSRRGGSVAIIADPTGGILALQKWPPGTSNPE